MSVFWDLYREWMRKAACGGMDTRLWLGRPGPTGRRFAIEVCQSCSVRTDCLEYAIRNHIRHGIWGGTTGDERRRMEQAA